ncbi:MAG: hypothetical protein QXJ28_00845 [Candidatus Pacearchaeota archaeon]
MKNTYYLDSEIENIDRESNRLKTNKPASPFGYILGDPSKIQRHNYLLNKMLYSDKLNSGLSYNKEELEELFSYFSKITNYISSHCNRREIINGTEYLISDDENMPPLEKSRFKLYLSNMKKVYQIYGKVLDDLISEFD